MTGERFSQLQAQILFAASADAPIYGEADPSRVTQAPGARPVFGLRTIESLCRRGYLREDGRGGFILTTSGAAARQRLIAGTGNLRP